MIDISVPAFFDEMEKVARAWLPIHTPSEGIIKSIARTRIGRALTPASRKGVRGAVRTGIRDLGNTADAAFTPSKSIKKGWKTTVGDFKNSGIVNKTLTVGGTLGSVAEVAPEEDPRHQGRSRLARGIQAGIGTAGSLIGAPHGIVGNLTAGVVADKAGSMVGKGVDATRNAVRNRMAARQPTPSVQHTLG